MRLTDTVDSSDFPEAELCALRLDGDAHALGLALVPVDVPVGAAVRAASLRPAVARHRLVVDSWAAAWVHGAWHRLPDPLTLAVDLRDGRRTRSVRPAPREAWFEPEEIVVLGGVRVASPFKTAFDLARLSERFEGDVVAVVRSLLDLAGLDAPAAATAAVAAAPSPHKNRAFTRLLALGRPDVLEVGSLVRPAAGAPRG